jgi:tetratricopeptide (TPR) repeat protein
MRTVNILLVVMISTCMSLSARSFAKVDTLVFDPTGEDTITTAITTNAEWRIAKTSPWCYAEKKAEAGLVIACQPNISLSPRLGSIEIDVGGAKVKVAVRQGAIDNPYRLGEYFFNTGREELARDCYQLGVDKGDSECQSRLGKFHFDREEFPEAKRLFELSAAQGNPRGENNLGFLYETGFGLAEPEPKEAVRWYQKSADKGFAPAQYNLGRMYETGNGVQPSVKDALQWYEKASLQGHEEAQERIRDLSYRSNPWL